MHPASLAQARVAARSAGRTRGLTGGEKAHLMILAAALTAANQRTRKASPSISPRRYGLALRNFGARTRSLRPVEDEPPGLDFERDSHAEYLA